MIDIQQELKLFILFEELEDISQSIKLTSVNQIDLSELVWNVGLTKNHANRINTGWKAWISCAKSKQTEIDTLKARIALLEKGMMNSEIDYINEISDLKSENAELKRQNRKLKYDVKVGDECIKRREQLINIRDAEIKELKAKLAKYENPTTKMIVTIEQKVEQQLKASGITQDPFRLDGETICQAMIEAAQGESHEN